MRTAECITKQEQLKYIFISSLQEPELGNICSTCNIYLQIKLSVIKTDIVMEIGA